MEKVCAKFQKPYKFRANKTSRHSQIEPTDRSGDQGRKPTVRCRLTRPKNQIHVYDHKPHRNRVVQRLQNRVQLSRSHGRLKVFPSVIDPW